jgi:hypothetical protein
MGWPQAVGSALEGTRFGLIDLRRGYFDNGAHCAATMATISRGPVISASHHGLSGMLLFDVLVAAHIITGTVGLIALWVPVVGRKGSVRHRAWGQLFSYALLATGVIAVGISLCTLYAPLETHPFSDDARHVRAVFGWMMLYLSVLTIMLVSYGRWCVRNRNAHQRNRTPLNFTLQALTLVTAVNCAWQGWLIGEPLLPAMAIVGVAAAVLNTRYILSSRPEQKAWLIHHSRGLVGAGISVYTAFLAFGAVNTMPALAFSPLVWATPTVLGVTYLLYHQFRLHPPLRRRGAA